MTGAGGQVPASGADVRAPRRQELQPYFPRAVIPGRVVMVFNLTRFPRAIPDIWNMPPRNAGLTGRGAGLEQLRDNLMGRGRAVVVAQALYGLAALARPRWRWSTPTVSWQTTTWPGGYRRNIRTRPQFL
jgi:hypothetical protein